MEQMQIEASVSTIQQTFTDREERLIEYLALHHISAGGLRERHVRGILKERLRAELDFESVVWPKFIQVVAHCKQNGISLLT